MAVLVFTMPAELAVQARSGAVTGFLISWIILNVIFLYRLTVERLVSNPATLDRGHDAGAAAAITVGCVFIRCVLRGRLRFRHAGRRHRGNPDGPWLLATGGRRPVVDRQHGAGRLRGARHADPGAGVRDRPRSLHIGGNGRAAAAVLLAHRAVLADLGVSLLSRHARDLARDPGLWPVLRGAASS
jgi:lactate permease